MRRTELFILLSLSLYALAVRLLPGIASADFGSAWDEGYYATVTHAALERPLQLLFPFIYESDLDRILSNKPPGLFWLGAFSSTLFGPTELSLRLISVMAGAASPAVLHALLKPYTGSNLALVAAGVLAASPLHVAFSRVYQMDAIGLFYALLTTHLLLRGIRRGDVRALYWAAPVVALALLTKLWSPMLPVVTLLPWLYREARQVDRSRSRSPLYGRTDRRLFLHVLGSLGAGFLAFSLWPLLLLLERDRYAGFLWMGRSGSVGQLLFSLYGTDLWADDPHRVLGQLFAPYQGLGHFDRDLLGTPLELVLVLMGGALLGVRCAREPSRVPAMVRASYPLLLWLAAFLPIHLGRRHHLQYLVILTPLWALLIAQGLCALSELSPRVGRVLAGIAAAVLLATPAYMVLSGKEILYRTHYREMGAFVRAQGGGVVACRYMPGLSYYTGRLERPIDRASPLARSVPAGVVRYVDFKRDERDNIMRSVDRNWVRSRCTDVSSRAGIPGDAPHALYDCASR